MISLKFKENIDNHFRQVIFANILLFLVSLLLVENYRLFSLLVTSYLFSVFTNWSFNYVVSLTIASCSDRIGVTEATHIDIKLRTIGRFLFQNDTIYRLFKYLNGKNMRVEFEKILNLGSEDNGSLQAMAVQKRQTTGGNIALEISIFIKKLSACFIENWYFSSISKNEQFPLETQLELEFLFNGN